MIVAVLLIVVVMGPFASLSQEVNVTMMQEIILQLQASVEELKASGGELKSSVQELEASMKKVKSSVKKVKSSVKEVKSSGEEVKDRVARIETENEEHDNKTDKLHHQFSREVEILHDMGSECLDLVEQLRGCNQTSVQSCFQPSGSKKFINGGHKSKNNFSEVITTIQEKNSRSDLYVFNNYTYRMSIIEGQLWVPVYSNNTILILDPYTSSKIKDITLTNIHPKISPRSVHQTNNNQVLLAAGQGLYVLDINGSYLYKVAGGKMVDIVVVSNKAYVYNYSDNNVVTVSFSAGQWVVTNTFTASRSSRSDLNTITHLDNKIYIGSRYSLHTIQSYTTTGTNVNTYNVPGSSPGQLLNPLLCGTDTQGSLLVCDRNKNRLQVLSPGGTWQVYVLPGVRKPYDVVVDTSGNLWVLWRDDIIFKYKISNFSI